MALTLLGWATDADAAGTVAWLTAAANPRSAAAADWVQAKLGVAASSADPGAAVAAECW